RPLPTPPRSSLFPYTTLFRSFYGSVLLLSYFMYLLCEPFLRPLAWAAIFAVFFHPLYRSLAPRLGKTGAAAISTAMVTLIVIVRSEEHTSELQSPYDLV